MIPINIKFFLLISKKPHYLFCWGKTMILQWRQMIEYFSLEVGIYVIKIKLVIKKGFENWVSNNN